MSTVERVTVKKDLVDCRGTVLARAGLVLSQQAIQEAARRAPALPRRLLADTFVSADLVLVVADPTYKFLFRSAGVAAQVVRALLAVQLPPSLYDQLFTWKTSDAPRYRHALATAAVTARMLTSAVGEVKTLPEVCAAALVHDIGMRHVPPALARNADPLALAEIVELAMHPLTGAFHLASVLGNHPAVQAALWHHWKCGRGYPRMQGAPPRSIDVIAVAATFAALTQPRPFRPEPYDARGAVDVLVEEAREGAADHNTVKLLVHALRGGGGDVRDVRFGRERLGHAPALNRHTPIAPQIPPLEL